MNILDIIEKKVNGGQLTKNELESAISGYISGEIPDYQMSSLLMAIRLNGMTEQETWHLTEVMINSGDVLSFDFNTVDKHSTGGVGDKTTLILVPLISFLGTKVMKMSGRGLGHTGGTIDKLESIEGFRVNLTQEEVKKQLIDVGACIVGQTSNLCPADKKIYALRDVTATVKSIPLIASSIMSKKIATGAKNIVIDLKVGNGALIDNIGQARTLANLMVKIGKLSGRNVIVLLTNMQQPLGYAVGNALEVKEAIDTLKGNGPKDLEELVINLGALMISLDQNIPLEIAIENISEIIKTGQSYSKFEEIVAYQGGNIERINFAENVIEIKAEKSGYIKNVNALKIGEIARSLGAGRLKKEDAINYAVGIVLNKKTSDYIEVGDTLAYVYQQDYVVSSKTILECFEIVNEKVEKPTLIYEIVK